MGKKKNGLFGKWTVILGIVGALGFAVAYDIHASLIVLGGLVTLSAAAIGYIIDDGIKKGYKWRVFK